MMDTDRSPCCQLHELMLAMEDSDPATSAALAAHLEACPHCQEDDLAVAPLLTAYRQQELAPLADDLEARGTPTFFINGTKVENVASWPALEPKLREAIG